MMQAPIDLVSDSESTGDSGDSDDFSDVAVVEPVDQAAAEVPCVADLLTSSDFTQHLLNDLHEPAQLPAACAPARCVPMLTLPHLAAVMVGLFDRTYLDALPEALADYQKLGDPEVVARQQQGLFCLVRLSRHYLPRSQIAVRRTKAK